MLDSAHTLTAAVVPYQPANPSTLFQFQAFLSDGASPLIGIGETELDAIFDLAEMLIESEQSAIQVLALIESVQVAAWVTGLIDWICGIDGGDAYIPAAIAHLETIDPQAAAERRKWFA